MPFERTEIHHIIPWEQGGATDLHNMLPVCSRHHHLIHTLRWRLVLHPDRSLTIYDDTGVVVVESPPPTRRPHAA